MIVTGPAWYCPQRQAASTNVRMLLHFDAAGPYIDQRGRTVTTTITTPGAVALDTTHKVFGPASVKFTAGGVAPGDFLSMPNNSLMDFGTGPFVFDVWTILNYSGPLQATILTVNRNLSTIFDMVSLVIGSTGQIRVDFTDTATANGGPHVASLISSQTFGTTFHHIRFGRVNATTLALAFDGTIVATTTISSSLAFSGASGFTYVGHSAVGGQVDYVGNVEELCARAVAMDSSNFVVPTSPFVYP